MVALNMMESPLEDPSVARANFSSSADLLLSDHDPEQLFQRCWRLNTCGDCLKSQLPCGWCPTSQACVPALAGLLTPLGDSKVCPMSSERFELRTKPLSCHVSTLTALTAIVSVLSTLLVVGILFLIVRYRASFGALWKRAWPRRSDPEDDNGSVDENTALLYSPRRAAAGIGRSWSFWMHNTTPFVAGRGEGPGRLQRSDTTGDEGESVGGRDFERRREQILHRSAEA